jgi:hypothetical protein
VAAWVLLLLAVAGVVRFGYVLLAKGGEPLAGDQIYYSAQAETIAEGGFFDHPYRPGVPAADHAPLTAVSLAPVSWSGDHLVGRQRLLMAFYGLTTVAFIGLAANRLAGIKVGLLALALAAVYANLWVNDGLVMSETLAALTTAICLYSAALLHERRTWQAAALLGLAGGVATLARAELILLAIPLAWCASRGNGAKSTRRLTGVAAAAALAVTLPWMTYNMVRFDEPTLMSTQEGLLLAGANCDQSYYGPGLGFWIYDCATAIQPLPGLDDSTVQTDLRSQALRYAFDHIDRWPTVIAARLGRGLSLWQLGGMEFLNTGEGREVWVTRIGVWQFWILIPLAAVGMWQLPLRQRGMLAVPLILSLLIIVVFYGIPRFRISAEVALVIAAAVGVEWLITRASDLRAAPVVPAATTTPGAPHPRRDALRRTATYPSRPR